MGNVVWIALGVGVLAFLVYRFFVPSVDKLAGEAAKTKDLGPLKEAISKKFEATQPAAYNHAIRRLWDGFQRDLALELIRDLAQNYAQVPIAQYWLKQALQVEPKMTKRKLGKKFIDTYYLPKLANQCGPAG
ncbi:MAG: hypothetical protein JRF33_03470 [Deltaproteobacteria bacterium]|nr:hypothetical protein [Deltaproteobacteria bacterium]